MIRLASVLVYGAIFAVSLASAQAADDDTASLDDTPHITVVGKAQTAAAPDVAEIDVGVATEKANAKDAFDSNAAVAAALVEAAKAAGVAAEDIRTQSIDLNEVFDEDRDPDGSVHQRRRGFRAAYDLVVRVHALADAGRTTEALIAKGANRFGGISFSVEHPDAMQAGLLAEATRDGRARAAAIAKAAGVRLGPLLQVERPDQAPQPPAGPRKMMMAQPATATPIEAGMQTFSAEVEMTYAILP